MLSCGVPLAALCHSVTSCVVCSQQVLLDELQWLDEFTKPGKAKGTFLGISLGEE
jgi:hypothetical protein